MSACYPNDSFDSEPFYFVETPIADCSPNLSIFVCTNLICVDSRIALNQYEGKYIAP